MSWRGTKDEMRAGASLKVTQKVGERGLYCHVIMIPRTPVIKSPLLPHFPDILSTENMSGKDSVSFCVKIERSIEVIHLLYHVTEEILLVEIAAFLYNLPSL